MQVNDRATDDPLAEAAIEAWMEGLQTSDHCEELVAGLYEKFLHPDLRYGDHAACTHLRPRFLSARNVRSLAGAGRQLLSAIDKADHAIVANREVLLPELGAFGSLERRLLDIPVRLKRTDVSVRLDATAIPGGWGFFELNGAIPGGLEIIHEVSELFRGCELFAAVERQMPLRAFDLRRAVCTSVLAAWKDWGGTGRPTIALVDWIEDAPLIGEFRVFASWMAEIGLDCHLVDPRELEISGDRLTARGQAIDLVYRRLAVMDMVERLAETEPLVLAAERGLACIIDPFQASVLDRKAIFAVLTDPELDFGLSAVERETVRRCVPWTRLVRDGATTLPDGTHGALLDFCRRARENLILKPNHDLGGHGVYLGWRLTATEWDTALEAALTTEFVVQTRIDPEMEAFPTVDAPLDPVLFEVSTDPYMFDGALEGILCRASGSGIANVTSGGASLVPCFVIDD